MKKQANEPLVIANARSVKSKPKCRMKAKSRLYQITTALKRPELEI